MKYSLCIEPVFEDVDFYDRIRLAAAAGLDAVEFWDPTKRDCAKIGRIAREEKLAVSICCAGDAWGSRLNEDPRAVTANIKKAVPLLREMDCRAMIALAGDLEGGADSQKNILIENLKRAAEILEKEEITLCVEALNSIRDHRGYYLDSSYVGFEIVKCVNSPRVKLLYDIYHMQIMEGNVIENATKNIAHIGHFHSAGVPGRHEHQYGELDYGNIQRAVEGAGYDRYFGLEYWPTRDSKESLAGVLAYLKGNGQAASP